jgi:hypothetical protein
MIRWISGHGGRFPMRLWSVGSGVAIVRVGSETATPMRRSP